MGNRYFCHRFGIGHVQRICTGLLFETKPCATNCYGGCRCRCFAVDDPDRYELGSRRNPGASQKSQGVPRRSVPFGLIDQAD